jgi:hypothetical protein
MFKNMSFYYNVAISISTIVEIDLAPFTFHWAAYIQAEKKNVWCDKSPLEEWQRQLFS